MGIILHGGRVSKNNLDYYVSLLDNNGVPARILMKTTQHGKNRYGYIPTKYLTKALEVIRDDFDKRMELISTEIRNKNKVK